MTNFKAFVVSTKAENMNYTIFYNMIRMSIHRLKELLKLVVLLKLKGFLIQCALRR